MTDWQPIETAPKLETGVHEILLCEIDGEEASIKIGWWDGHHWNIGEPFADQWNWTHWMPLPDPPKD